MRMTISSSDFFLNSLGLMVKFILIPSPEVYSTLKTPNEPDGNFFLASFTICTISSRISSRFSSSGVFSTGASSIGFITSSS